MMCPIMQNNTRKVLEEGNSAYISLVESGGAPNVDYAGYCCQVALSKLRQSLNNPKISADHLEGLLRYANRKYMAAGSEREFSNLMANYLISHMNIYE